MFTPLERIADGWAMGSDISMCIATIPPRKDLLARAVNSVLDQTLRADQILIETDVHHTGAACTKNRALARAETPWTAFLDDDDWLHPNHLELLYGAAEATGADVVYSWPVMDGGNDPRPDMFGQPFDADELRRGSYLHTTIMVRTELAQKVGGFQKPAGSDYDDWGLHLALLDAGAVFHHVPERTWVWTVNGQNTSGSPLRW